MDARAVLRGADVVLVDLDGPLTRLLPGRRWLELSAQVRTWAEELAGPALAQTLAGEDDHVQCLRAVHRLAPDVAARLVTRVTTAELDAARRAWPAEGAVDLLEQCLARGPVAVVTNNDPGVVPLVLDAARPGLTGRLAAVLGRETARLQDLKPSPAMLLRALDVTGTRAEDAVFLGDSVSDVRAGEAAGVRVLGVAADRGRREQLVAAGAVAAVPGASSLLDAGPPIIGG